MPKYCDLSLSSVDVWVLAVVTLLLVQLVKPLLAHMSLSNCVSPGNWAVGSRYTDTTLLSPRAESELVRAVELQGLEDSQLVHTHPVSEQRAGITVST